MKRNRITITDGIVNVPANVRMTYFEIAELFGVFTKTVRANIKAILKSGVVKPDFSTGATVIGSAIYTDYYGLEMVTALAFRVNSLEAQLFRNYATQKLYHSKPLFIQIPKNVTVN